MAPTPDVCSSVASGSELCTTPHEGDKKLVCVLVGLPARGKTYIAQKIRRYMIWMGTECRVFNVGQYRRMVAGANCGSNFFDPLNKPANEIRNEVAARALSDMLSWLSAVDGPAVGIFDATNTTRERRTTVLSMCSAHGAEVIFIESVCNDPEVIASNIADVKLSGPDYHGVDAAKATQDFQERMRHYENVYETIADDEKCSFMKIINVGTRVAINRIKGWIQSRIVYFLMNLHIQPRRILFSRHGESEFNVSGLIGGDSNLSPRGEQYARALPNVIANALGPDAELTVWVSTLKRTHQTAAYLPFPKIAWKALDELDAGLCDGMTYEDIEEQFPEDFADRDRDKFNYRYRGGESYRDLVVRLEPVILELERRRNILIIGHQAILRCIYAYFMGHSSEDLPYIRVPLHTVISLTPQAHTCEERRYVADIAAVDTHRGSRSCTESVTSSQASGLGSSKEKLGSNLTHKDSCARSSSVTAELLGSSSLVTPKSNTGTDVPVGGCPGSTGRGEHRIRCLSFDSARVLPERYAAVGGNRSSYPMPLQRPVEEVSVVTPRSVFDTSPSEQRRRATFSLPSLAHDASDLIGGEAVGSPSLHVLRTTPNTCSSNCVSEPPPFENAK